MPPKVVYGKKKGTARKDSSFTKFLSLKKAPSTAEHSPVSAEGQTWRQQLELAAQSVDKENELEDAVAVLEKGLGGLQIGPSGSTEQVSKHRRAGAQKPERARKTKGTQNTMQEVAGGDDSLERGMEALTVKTPVVDKDAPRKKPGRPRKALEDRDANMVRDATAPPRTPRSSSKATTLRSTASQGKPQLPTPEPTPEPEDCHVAYVSTLASLSDRKKLIQFEEWSAQLGPHFNFSKIAEASFSEVYRLAATASANKTMQESVLKVVALKTPPDVPLPCQLHPRAIRDRETQEVKEQAEREEKDQWKSHVEDVVSEVRLLHNLNHIPGFTVFRDVTIVQGRPSAPFNDAWKEWNKSRPRGKKSEFPDPSKKTSYDDTQLWAIIEMQDAGTDCEKIMESGGLTSIWEIWDVFWGVCLSVAKAEEACKFEHRDLHMGNICVRTSRLDNDVFRTEIKDPLKRKLRFTGLETTVIDYTLSRADMVPSSSSDSDYSPASSQACSQNVAYLDLNKDMALFEGDAAEEYQYEIYRYMRGAALYNNPLQSAPTPIPAPVPEVVMLTPRRSPRKNTHIRFPNSDDEEAPAPRRSPRKSVVPQLVQPEEPEDDLDVWSKFHPKTNLVWTHFLLHKLLNHLHEHDAAPERVSSKQIINGITLEAGEDVSKIKKKGVKLYKILQRVSDLLCPVALSKEEGLSSVKELVVLSLEERWLRVGDVAA